MKTLIKLRKAENLSQREVAENLGLTTQAIHNYEKGTREPNIEVLKRMSNFFNVSIDYLLENEIENKTIYTEEQKTAIKYLIELNKTSLAQATGYLKALIDDQERFKRINEKNSEN
ncbi:MAG: helix-turn-helix transcriptional regulator [Clostridia bacterium]|nr:helix-turn-helix transcriptional regulator [Clostridia bacterium]